MVTMESREQKLEWINRRERQLLVHSCLYYRMNQNIVSDYDFDLWAKQLVEMMEQEPVIFSESVYYADFKTFDGSTGHDLPFWRDEIVNIAAKLIRIQKLN